MSTAIVRRSVAAALLVVAATAVAEAGSRAPGAAVARARARAAPHESYRMSAARRAWTRARGQLTDANAAALVADGALSEREAFLLVRSGVEARRVARALAQEPGEVGAAFSVRAEKLQRLGLSRREARILARSGARPARVREVTESLVYRFQVGTDPAWAVPPEPPAGGDREARLRASLAELGVDPDAPDPLGAARRAYRAIARESHPDRVGARSDLTAPEKAAAVRRFEAAAAHYETVVEILQPPRR